ncbi:hypothetical protein BC835DRAFT_1306795 [Cytidiella melzeri]|nr:hypothetical protein BC835DRAFT_1306795 [Cytidiella melzeri]
MCGRSPRTWRRMVRGKERCAAVCRPIRKRMHRMPGDDAEQNSGFASFGGENLRDNIVTANNTINRFTKCNSDELLNGEQQGRRVLLTGSEPLEMYNLSPSISLACDSHHPETTQRPKRKTRFFRLLQSPFAATTLEKVWLTCTREKRSERNPSPLSTSILSSAYHENRDSDSRGQVIFSAWKMKYNTIGDSSHDSVCLRRTGKHVRIRQGYCAVELGCKHGGNGRCCLPTKIMIIRCAVVGWIACMHERGPRWIIDCVGRETYGNLRFSRRETAPFWDSEYAALAEKGGLLLLLWKVTGGIGLNGPGTADKDSDYDASAQSLVDATGFSSVTTTRARDDGAER